MSAALGLLPEIIPACYLLHGLFLYASGLLLVFRYAFLFGNVSRLVENMPPPPKKKKILNLAPLTSEAFSSACLRGLPRPLFSVASFSFGETVPLSLMFAYLFFPLLRPGKQVAPVRT